MMTAFLLISFWILQILANICFKYGGDNPNRWWGCFVLGNILCILSIYFIMRLYARMDASIVLAFACGGTFLAIQLGMCAVFGGRPTVVQWGGFMLMAIGMTIGALGGNPSKTESAPKTVTAEQTTATIDSNK
jgi:hypothetical protein